MVERWTKVLTKKTTIAVLTVMIITMMLIAANVQALTNASATLGADDSDGPWAERATKALKRARHEIDDAIDKIVEQAGQGANVSLAKGILKASIRIYGAAERLFGEGHYKKAFFTAVLSGLVAHDSARVATEGPKAIDAIIDEVEEKLDQVKKYIKELEKSGVDVSLARKVLERAEKLYTKAEELMKEEKPVRALVGAEISRILAHVAEKIAQRSQQS